MTLDWVGLRHPQRSPNSAEDLDRCALKARAAVCALVGEALAEAGIDPACAPALRLAPHPDPLPAIGAKEQLEELAASDDDGLAGKFAAKIGDIARRYEDGCAPDFGIASLAELFAWSLVRRGRSPGTPHRAGSIGPGNQRNAAG